MSQIIVYEGTAPPTPPAGTITIYAKIDGRLYWMDDTGVETPFYPQGAGTGDLLSDGTVALVANWDAGGFQIRSLQFYADATTGTAPFVVDSTTLVTNLNADQLDGQEGSYYASVAYVDAAVVGLLDHKGGYNAATNTPDLDVSPAGVLQGDAYVVTAAGTFYSTPLEVGDWMYANIDSPASAADWTIVEGSVTGALVDADFASDGMMRAVDGSGTYSTIKINLAATAPPTATDDTNAGYEVGSSWWDTTNDLIYLCIDATASNAIWTQVGSGSGGGMTVTPVKTANYTANENEVVPVDSSGGTPFTITMPASATAQSRVIVIDVGKALTDYNVTLARNGATFDGLAEDFVMDVSHGRVDASSDGSNNWSTHLIAPPTLVNSPSALLGSATVSGAAATSITISGLDLSAHAGFVVVARLKNPTGSSAAISLFYNGDVTATNYWTQRSIAGGSGAALARTNDAELFNISAGESATGTIEILSDPDGKPKAISNFVEDSASIRGREAWQHWVTAANVTQITLSADVASSLDVGSTVEVYALEQGGGASTTSPATGATVARTTSQTGIISTTDTPVVWENETRDEGAYANLGANNTRLTVSVDGWYLVSCFVRWDSNATGTRQLSLRKNGIATDYGLVTHDGLAYAPQDTTVPIYLNAGDYVEAIVRQASGANRSIDVTFNPPFMSIVRMSGQGGGATVAPGTMVELGEATVAGAAATSIAVGGLDLSAYTAFKVIGSFKNATGSNSDLSLYYNADTTATNYYRQIDFSNSATANAAANNTGSVGTMLANSDSLIEATIVATVSSGPRAVFAHNSGQTTGMYIYNGAHYWVTAANVTSITISAAVASSLDIGSTFKVYGIK